MRFKFQVKLLDSLFTLTVHHLLKTNFTCVSSVWLSWGLQREIPYFWNVAGNHCSPKNETSFIFFVWRAWFSCFGYFKGNIVPPWLILYGHKPLTHFYNIYFTDEVLLHSVVVIFSHCERGNKPEDRESDADEYFMFLLFYKPNNKRVWYIIRPGGPYMVKISNVPSLKM